MSGHTEKIIAISELSTYVFKTFRMSIFSDTFQMSTFSIKVLV
jgi:hypothetical protein